MTRKVTMSAPDCESHNHTPPAGDALTADERERRAALQRLGRIAVYTPPALLLLLTSQRATAQSLLGDPPPDPDGF
jgi:hypothetical protein